ncbi:MAG: FAD-dependent oxidoreductase [Chlamydiales bacterium]|nr:FAD-dependent oxidoreductase [Chlamydiales bacterium]
MNLIRLIVFLLFFPIFLLQALFAKEIETNVQPVVILGGGVGALTSALYLSRAGTEPILVEGANPGGLITQSHAVENWPGELEISGSDLTQKMRSQVMKNGAIFLSEEVVKVDFSKRPFVITTRSLAQPDQTRQIRADACIIAMGTQSNYLGVPGETGLEGYWGKGVSNCAICDGSFYKDRTVGIVGGGDAAVLEGLYLSQIAKKVYLFLRKDAFKAGETKRLKALLAKPNVQVLYETQVVEILGNGEHLTHVSVEKAKTKEPFLIALDGLFLAIGSKPNTQIFQDQLNVTSAGYIELIEDQQTSVPGVFAVGDIVDPVYKQAIVASADGAKAAIQAQKYLFDRMAQIVNLPKIHPKSNEIASSQTETRVVKKEAAASYLASLPEGAIEIHSKEQFDQELLGNQIPVIIDFYAPWCGPCKKIAPRFEHSASEFSGKMKFLKVNVDKFYGLSQSYQVTAMPTVVVLDSKGSIVDRRVGPEAIADLLQHLDTLN